jgi:hypothetical protein
MVVVTGGISKITVAIGAFDRGPVRCTRGVCRTKRATMRAGGMVFFDVAASDITMITVVGVFCHHRHGKYGIVMLIIQ